jgi:hypothetical protein
MTHRTSAANNATKAAVSKPCIGGAGVAWIAAFGGFALIYGGRLLRLPANKRA